MPEKSQYEAELAVAVSIAHEAGDIMRQYFDSDQERQIKSDGTPLTIADTKINSLVIERLSEVYPDDGVIGEEESTTEYGLGRKWFCDPIDGTKAFTWGVPTAMFSLGLVIDGVPTLGVCYEPITDRMYYACIGSGAHCNGEAIRVNTDDVHSGIVATISDQKRIRHSANYLDALIDQQVSMAAFSGGVAKAVRVAEGRFVGYTEELLNAYDIAAVHVIVSEAGGMITALDGQPLDYTRPIKGAVISNGVVHDTLLAAMAQAGSD